MRNRSVRATRLLALALTSALVVAACSDDPDDRAAPGGTTAATATSTSASSTTEATGPGTTDPAEPDTTEPAEPDVSVISGPGESFRFVPFADCAAFLGYVRTEALERVTPWGLDGGYYPSIEGDVAVDSGGAVPTIPPVGRPTGAPATTMAAAEAGADAAASAQTAPPGDGDSSGTNTQEAGVDEGDLVENDGQRVYSVLDGRLRIVDIASAAEVGSAELPDGQHQILLDGTRLAVVTSVWDVAIDTVVSVYDVADPANPALLGRTHLEGEATGVRAADGTARIVLSSSFGQRLPFVHPDGFSPNNEETAEAENRRIIEESTPEQWLPRTYVESEDGTASEITTGLDCATVGHPGEFAGLGLVWIASVPLQASDLTAVGSAGVVSSGGTTYASATTLYVATTRWPEYKVDGVAPNQAEPVTTAIHSFDISGGGAASYLASGQVPGVLLNQFSMSEFEGVLRVAVTEQDEGFGSPSSSSVRVLQRDGDALKEVGSVGGLGATEQIYAVRFIGALGYVVTFRQTDPLYVIDLHDPANPTVAGELKIPGYSAYLHPISDTLLLGIGQAATEEGRTLGTKLSLFDVSDPAAPAEVAGLDVGGSSSAEFDHHAFLWWPSGTEDPLGQAVIPFADYRWDQPLDDTGNPVQPEFGAVVAQVSGGTVTEQGKVTHQGRADDGSEFSDYYLDMVQRSMVVGGQLVTVSPAGVLVSDLAALGDVAWVPFSA